MGLLINNKNIITLLADTPILNIAKAYNLKKNSQD